MKMLSCLRADLFIFFLISSITSIDVMAGNLLSGVVDRLYMQDNGSVMVTVVLDGESKYEIQPSCALVWAEKGATYTTMYLPPIGGNTLNKAYYGTLLAAKLSNNRVDIYGHGSCLPEESNKETIKSISVL